MSQPDSASALERPQAKECFLHFLNNCLGEEGGEDSGGGGGGGPVTEIISGLQSQRVPPNIYREDVADLCPKK